jgi:hypothetical protein
MPGIHTLTLAIGRQVRISTTFDGSPPHSQERETELAFVRSPPPGSLLPNITRGEAIDFPQLHRREAQDRSFRYLPRGLALA